MSGYIRTVYWNGDKVGKPVSASFFFIVLYVSQMLNSTDHRENAVPMQLPPCLHPGKITIRS